MAYTCPIHPEIRRKTPGKCPKCGTDLVPVGTTPHDLIARQRDVEVWDMDTDRANGSAVVAKANAAAAPRPQGMRPTCIA